MSADIVITGRPVTRTVPHGFLRALFNFIVVLLVTFVSPIAGLVLSVVVFLGETSRCNAVACAFTFGIAMAFISYGIEYNHAVDMTRWMAECAYYAGRPIESIFTSMNQDHASLLVWNVWCWVVGNIGDLKLLQASAAFFGYGMLAWLFMDACASEGTPRFAFITVFALVLLAVPMQTIVGNVRSTLASVLCCIAFYIRAQGGSKHIVVSLSIIIVACLIHKSMVLALGIWLLLPAISTNPKKMALVFGIGVYVVIGASNLIISTGVFSGLPFLEEALSLADFYTEGTEWDQAQADSLFQIINHAIRIAMLLLLLIRISVTGQKTELWSIALVGTCGVLAMEMMLVNVGLRFQYIPLLVGLLMLLNKNGRDRAICHRWPLLIDFILMTLSVAVTMISYRDFIPSFNYAEVASAALFFPGVLF